jgi:8-oxo-dGTP pyrophosphatase MutT (NUDIX family)
MEKSCGIVLFRSEDFLLIQHSDKLGVKGHWDFPKGHIEGNETELETATRELEEETGIREFQLVDDFKERISYNIHRDSKIIPKVVTFFLAESSTNKVRLSSEHQNYKWLNFRSAHDQLTYSNAKKVLVKAKNFLDY